MTQAPPSTRSSATLRRRGQFDALRQRGLDPLATLVLPRLLAGLFAVLLLAALSCAVTLVLAYLSAHGFSLGGFERYTRPVGRVFTPSVSTRPWCRPTRSATWWSRSRCRLAAFRSCCSAHMASAAWVASAKIDTAPSPAVSTNRPPWARKARSSASTCNCCSCRPLGEVPLKGAGRAMALLSLHWLDRSRFPVAVRIRESGERIDIPLQDIVSYGRLDIIEGMPANDVVLTLPDEVATRQISRWHFELRRRIGGYTLRSVSTNPTVVDGRVLQRGDEAPALPGSVVMLAGVMTLDLLGPPGPDDASGDATMVVA